MTCSLNHGPARDALLAYASIVCNPDETARCWAWLGLTDAGETLQRSLSRELALHDLSEGGFAILAQIIRSEPDAVPPDNLSIALGLSRAATNNLLGRLEVSGLIQHERPDREQRESPVRVTTAGRHTFSQALKHHLAAILRTMSALDPVDITTLDRACNRLRHPSPSASSL